MESNRRKYNFILVGVVGAGKSVQNDHSSKILLNIRLVILFLLSFIIKNHFYQISTILSIDLLYYNTQNHNSYCGICSYMFI